MQFESFITRLSEEGIEKIVGNSAIQILNILDTNLSRLGRLQSVILSIYSPHELLQNKDVRNELIDLLKINEAKELCILFDKPTSGDVFSTLKAVKFTTEYEKNKLFRFFELELDDFPIQDSALSRKEICVNYPLFKHQRAALNELGKKLNSRNRRALLHMPTGSGKTRTAMNFICNHMRAAEPTIVIWLAHTEELCEQAASEFETAWKSLGDREVNVLRYWGSNSEDVSTFNDGFVVGGLSKVFNLLKVDAAKFSKLASRCTLVIMDEAHMAIAPTFKLILEVINTFNSSLIGLSATPGRTWNNPEADRELSNFFNNTKISLKVDGYDNPINYLVDKGYLAEVINSPLLYQSGYTISNHDLKYLHDNFQLSNSFIKKLSEDQKRNIVILKRVEDLITRHKRIILFAMTVEHSNLLATCLQARGVCAFSITGNTSSLQRRNLINQFKSNDETPMILCNYGILTTGFDAPQTSCALISRPTDSLVLYSQMVGRAIRGPNAGGNIKAEIVTVIDSSLPGFDAVASAFYNWEDVWN